MREEAEMFFSC